jgi:UMF1 family MFS transporter
MPGKFAAVLGRLLIGIIAAMSDSSRLAMFSVSILFICGGILLYFVDEKKAVQVTADIDAQ